MPITKRQPGEAAGVAAAGNIVGQAQRAEEDRAVHSIFQFKRDTVQLNFLTMLVIYILLTLLMVTCILAQTTHNDFRLPTPASDIDGAVNLQVAIPNITRHATTHSDTAGSGSSKDIYKREDGAGTITSAFQFEASHDGAVANDQLGKGVWSVNTGAGLVQALEIGSNLAIDAVGDFTAGTIQADNGVSGTLELDDGATEKITLVFTGGILTSRTVAATTGAALANWTD